MPLPGKYNIINNKICELLGNLRGQFFIKLAFKIFLHLPTNI